MAKTKESHVFQRHLPSSPIVTNSQRKYPLSLPSAERTVSFLLKQKGHAQMGLHFVGIKKISTLHAEYFDDPSPTDCITFRYNDLQFLGEVYVCPHVAKEYVSSYGGDLEEELTLYVVHGFLHLLGFDDQTKSNREKMRIEEKKWMRMLAKNKLGITIK